MFTYQKYNKNNFKINLSVFIKTIVIEIQYLLRNFEIIFFHVCIIFSDLINVLYIM